MTAQAALEGMLVNINIIFRHLWRILQDIGGSNAEGRME
jgi:hypothetical protein